jgi:hypothetical protein
MIADRHLAGHRRSTALAGPEAGALQRRGGRHRDGAPLLPLSLPSETPEFPPEA